MNDQKYYDPTVYDATKADLDRLEKKIDRAIRLLERLTDPIGTAIREGHYGPALQQAALDSDANGT